jgi:hypothetical protein
MSVFDASSRLSSLPIDPLRRVNYTLGMVLGVDDFIQDQTWHAEALRHVLRDLVGYGTVRGLRVTARGGAAEGPEVVVAPGVAVTPRGEVVRVGSEQCARLNAWLATGGSSDASAQRAHRDAVQAALVLDAPPDTGTLTVHVVLDYAECTVDPRPVPGEACRAESQVLVDARIKNSFALSLRLTAPRAIEPEGYRDLLAWLSMVPVVDFAATDNDLGGFLDALRASATPAAGASPSTGVFLANPPAAARIPLNAVSAWWRAAFRVYATELRANPTWLAPGQDATGASPTRAAEPPAGVLLSSLRVRVTRNVIGDTSIAPWVVIEAGTTPDVTPDDAARPVLLPSDLHTEALLRALTAYVGGVGATPSVVRVAGGVVPVAPSGVGAPTVVPPGAVHARALGANGEVELRFNPGAAGTHHVTVTPVLAAPAVPFAVNLTAAPAAAGGGGLWAARVCLGRGAALATEAELVALQLMVEITRWP